MVILVECNFCHEFKPVEEFKKIKTIKAGYTPTCMLCKNEKQRKYRLETKNLQTYHYEKTRKGFLVRVYRNMLSRVSGVTKDKNHLYLGLEILDKDLFYSWSLLEESFNKLFQVWEEARYDRKLTPSIDRVNPERGYTLDNIRWITFTENCRDTRRWTNANNTEI